MILLLALMQATPAPAPPEEEIVVIARKLNQWRGKIRTNPLGTKCVTERSTGDREIDAVGCTALERCWPDTLPRMKAAQAKGVSRPDRQRLKADAMRSFDACVRPQRDALIEALHARRAAMPRAGA